MPTLKLGSTTALTETSGALTINVANPTVTLGSNADITGCTFPAGHVVFSQNYVLSGTSDTSQPGTSGGGGAEEYWTDTGLQITIASANVALGSKIFISWSHLMGINQGVSSRQADARLKRTAPSDSDLCKWKYWGLGMNDDAGTEHLRLNSSGSCMDESLGSGDHTYKLQFRCANGDTNHCGAIYYKGYAGTTHSIQAMVIK